jgi:DNA-binding transcriptional ArsR family regulator
MARTSRPFIINELRMHKCCVNEMIYMIKTDASTVSKHLSVLRNADVKVIKG